MVVRIGTVFPPKSSVAPVPEIHPSHLSRNLCALVITNADTLQVQEDDGDGSQSELFTDDLLFISIIVSAHTINVRLESWRGV